MSRIPGRSRPEHRLLEDGRRARTMIWIMAIMLFLTTLAAAIGLGMAAAAGSLDRQLAGRLSIQLVDTDAARRDARARAIVTAVRDLPGVTRAAEVDRARLAELLRPWLGDAGLDAGLPMPALIDVDVADASRVAAVEAAARRLAPSARVDRHGEWLSPVRGFIAALAWLAAAVVLLMALATGAVTLLAARAGLDAHRSTIDVLHMLGSTDAQVARLFQRRIALDTLAGGIIGTAAALVTAWALQMQIGTLGSELLGGIALGQREWLMLAALPLIFVVLAMLAARFAVLRALGRIL